MNMRFALLALACLTLVSSCIKKDNEDKPVITLLSPAPCDTLYFGEAFNFSIKVSDADGLGNVKMDLHNNFGHHQHGDHQPCELDAAKTPVKPYFNEWIYSMPENKKEHTHEAQIILTADNYDTGDYHFHIYATDNIGYQSFTTLSVKVLNR